MDGTSAERSQEAGRQIAAVVRMTEGQDIAARQLLDRLTELRAEIAHRATRRMSDWAPLVRRTEFLSSVENLADWLALRETDLTPVQPALGQLGLSSLGRLDGHVRPSLDAVIAALSLIAGEPEAVFPDPSAISGGAALLAERRSRLFGDRPEGTGPETRIMVTLAGETALTSGRIADLAAAGADCFRINCAHDGPGEWREMIRHIRDTGARLGRRLPISMDLGGPKFRVARVWGPEKLRLGQGDRFALVLSPRDLPGKLPAAQLSDPALVQALGIGALVSLDDGKLWAEVTARRGGAAELVVTRAPDAGLRLKPGKGVNLPGIDLDVPALTAEDRAALDVVVPLADIVAFSFVQTPADVRGLIDAMEERAGGLRLPAVLLKIETPLALRNLPDLIVEAGGRVPVGVMIARGDLAVEIGFDRLSEIQEEVLWLCEAAQVPVVWATQVLEGMVKEGQASRAEITDAAMSQRAECVMLNKGAHQAEAVSFLRDILMRMDRHQDKKRARLSALGLWRQG
ncbi:pyruvate kinase [Neotabrizicola shimadae]|nr:pyruvate kinase [Neotabrizicola shimadae]